MIDGRFPLTDEQMCACSEWADKDGNAALIMSCDGKELNSLFNGTNGAMAAMLHFAMVKDPVLETVFGAALAIHSNWKLTTKISQN